MEFLFKCEFISPWHQVKTKNCEQIDSTIKWIGNYINTAPRESRLNYFGINRYKVFHTWVIGFYTWPYDVKETECVPANLSKKNVWN